MRIAIAGYGAEGRSNYRYFMAQGGHEVTIVDERDSVDDIPDGAPVILGKDAFGKLQEFDLVVRTAGLNPNKIQTNGKIWSATNEFFARSPADIIGVTGSKGKGTTCSLIANILRAAGRTVHLVGNIGVPALDELPQIQSDDIVVYELSSFQLWDLEKSPHVAVILHIEADHLDVHTDMEEYIRAKANIRLHQTIDDICFYHPTNPYTQQIIDMRGDWPQDDFQLRNWKWRAFRYDAQEIRDVSVASAYIKDYMFCIKRPEYEQFSTIPLSTLKIPGAHNQQNACAAIDAALVYGVSDEAISEGLSSFEGLPHRLKLIRTVDDVQYYDDSIATTPGSAIAAMEAFPGPKVMIIGGSSKGADFSEMAEKAGRSNVKAVIAIGEEAPKIEQAMKRNNVVTFDIGTGVSMQDIVTLARTRVQSGDTVILSPACASFDMFKNYADRGDQFISAVSAL